MPRHTGKNLGPWESLQYDNHHHHPEQEMYAAIETDFGICVEMKNCGLVESFLENEICYPEDEAPLTLSWLSGRWHDSTSSAMNRNVQKLPGFLLNNSRCIYQTTINYRRSLNLREGHDKSISEEVLRRDEASEEISRHAEDRKRLKRNSSPEVVVVDRTAGKSGPKKRWIRHYYLTNGNDMWLTNM